MVTLYTLYRVPEEQSVSQTYEPPLSRNADFVRLWVGDAVSGLGSSITSLVYPLLALAVTHSAALAGLVSLVALTTGALLQLPAGVVIDRVPLRPVLVVTDVLRLLTTATLALSVVTGHLRLWQLLLVAAVNSGAGVFRNLARSVALRHVVAAPQLPQAFALDEGRNHAIGLVGQPVGGVSYATAPVLPLVADLVSFAVSATLSTRIRHPLRPTVGRRPRRRLKQDVLTGMTFLWHEPFLRATLLAAAAYQLVFGGAIFALVASATAGGASARTLGAVFGVAAAGGILGALATPALQARWPLKTLVVVMGWTAAAAFAAWAWLDRPLLAGILLGCLYFTAAPANAVLLAAQITRTPASLQGRVMSASYLVAGLAAPLGPPIGGLALDYTSPGLTFTGIATLTALVTVAVHLNRPMGTTPPPARYQAS